MLFGLSAESREAWTPVPFDSCACWRYLKGDWCSRRKRFGLRSTPTETLIALITLDGWPGQDAAVVTAAGSTAGAGFTETAVPPFGSVSLLELDTVTVLPFPLNCVDFFVSVEPRFRALIRIFFDMIICIADSKANHSSHLNQIWVKRNNFY